MNTVVIALRQTIALQYTPKYYFYLINLIQYIIFKLGNNCDQKYKCLAIKGPRRFSSVI